MKMAYRLAFVLMLSVLLTDIAFAQAQATASNPFSTPKLLVFGIAVAVSIITDGVVMGFLAGGFHPMRAIVSSIPFSFLNVFWYDVIVPAAGMPILAIKFMPVGNPAWNYFIGMNVVVAFLGNLVWEQVIFRFARGAATSGWGTDLFLGALDAMLPAILFIVLPMAGII